MMARPNPIPEYRPPVEHYAAQCECRTPVKDRVYMRRWICRLCNCFISKEREHA